jgi:hypothetical protein
LISGRRREEPSFEILSEFSSAGDVSVALKKVGG